MTHMVSPLVNVVRTTTVTSRLTLKLTREHILRALRRDGHDIPDSARDVEISVVSCDENSVVELIAVSWTVTESRDVVSLRTIRHEN